MKKIIDASDLFLKKLGSYIDLFLAKVKLFFSNIYTYYILPIVVLFLIIFYEITHYKEFGDVVVIGVCLFFIFLLIVLIGKEYYLSKEQKSDILKGFDKNFVDTSMQNDYSISAHSISKNLLLNVKEEKDYYKPSKKITPKKARNLSIFYNSKASEFIDITNVSEVNFINLISDEKEISIEERIFVFSELTNEKIVYFLDGIGHITGISRSQLGKLFKKQIESTGEIKKVNELTLNSSISQANKKKKVNFFYKKN